MKNQDDLSNAQLFERLKALIKRVAWTLGFIAAGIAVWGLVADSFTTSADEALLNAIEGRWGNVSSQRVESCARTFQYSIDQSPDEVTITLASTEIIATGRVTAISNGSVHTRTITPRENAGETWELRFDGDRLLQVDKDGVTTALVRCPDSDAS